jgi:hypothetical protein
MTSEQIGFYGEMTAAMAGAIIQEALDESLMSGAAVGRL